MAGNKPITPVRPIKMEIVFLYPCPFCGHNVPTIASNRPTLVQCDACHENFPIVPIDAKTVDHIKISLADGRAAVDADFI